MAIKTWDCARKMHIFLTLKDCERLMALTRPNICVNFLLLFESLLEVVQDQGRVHFVQECEVANNALKRRAIEW